MTSSLFWHSFDFSFLSVEQQHRQQQQQKKIHESIVFCLMFSTLLVVVIPLVFVWTLFNLINGNEIRGPEQKKSHVKFIHHYFKISLLIRRNRLGNIQKIDKNENWSRPKHTNTKVQQTATTKKIVSTSKAFLREKEKNRNDILEFKHKCKINREGKKLLRKTNVCSNSISKSTTQRSS